jgi:hypothetical protein
MPWMAVMSTSRVRERRTDPVIGGRAQRRKREGENQKPDHHGAQAQPGPEPGRRQRALW